MQQADFYTLLSQGAVVMPASKAIPAIDAFQQMVRDQFRTLQSNDGSFSLLTHGQVAAPESYHNPCTRNAEKVIYAEYLHPLGRFLQQELSNNEESPPKKRLRLRQHKGALCIRSQGKEATRRPPCLGTAQATKAEKSLVLVEGWVNLSEKATQYFHYLPGSHQQLYKHYNIKEFDTAARMVVTDGEGTKNGEAELCKRIKTIEVPPRHVIVYFQKLLMMERAHKVKAPDDWRLKFGASLYYGERNLMDTDYVEKVRVSLETQACVPDVDNQCTELYAAAHISKYLKSAVAWCQQHVAKDLWKDGEKLPMRRLPSLQEYQGGGHMFPAYSSDELERFVHGREV